MTPYTNPAALSAWDDRLERQMFDHLFPGQPVPAHLLRPCEQRTVGEAAAKVGRADRPRNQTVRCDDSLRREQVCGYSRMLPR